jgi:uncharacterized protein
MKRMFLFAAVLAVQTCFSQMDERFYFPNREWKPVDNYNFEEIFFYPENDTLSTILMKPDADPKASILYFHGSGGNVSNYMPLAQPLVDAGYQILMVDFRGYGHSSGKPTHSNIAADAQYVLEQMQSLPAVEDQKILLYGSSMGTQAAINLARKNQEIFEGLVLDGALSSFIDIALLHAPPEMHFRIQAMEDVFPYIAKEDITHIEDLPILFIHSKEDKEVPFSQGETLYEAAKAPKSFWIYEGDHIKAPALYPDELVEKVDQLLQE